MPTVRTGGGGGGGEGEGIDEGGVVGKSSVARITGNMTLADHMGKFIAGEVVKQYLDEDLTSLVKGKNAIMISGSWG